MELASQALRTVHSAVKLGVVKKDDFGCKSILTFGNVLSYPPQHVERLETNTQHLVFGFSTVLHWWSIDCCGQTVGYSHGSGYAAVVMIPKSVR